MKIQTTLTFALVLVFLTTSLVSAYPGIPHQFYGTVTVNGQPAPDNQILVAEIDGDLYTTITKDGKFGFAPNIFYVEDPEGDRTGDITFYLGTKSGTLPGKQDESKTSIQFENNGYDELNLEFKTSIGDGYCLGEETCANNPNDCGMCKDPPIITIVSPENKVYDTPKIDLIVTSDQSILMWLYSLNGEDFVTFTPDITITAFVNETTGIGDNNLIVKGFSINNIGMSEVSFTVELPVATCSDGIQNQGETGVDCGGPCTACSNDNGGGGGGGGGGSSGGGGSTLSNTQTSGTSSLNLNIETEGTENTGSETQEPSSQEEETLGAGITGAVIGFVKTRAGIGVSIALLIIIMGIVVMAVQKKKTEK